MMKETIFEFDGVLEDVKSKNSKGGVQKIIGLTTRQLRAVRSLDEQLGETVKIRLVFTTEDAAEERGKVTLPDGRDAEQPELPGMDDQPKGNPGDWAVVYRCENPGDDVIPGCENYTFTEYHPTEDEANNAPTPLCPKCDDSEHVIVFSIHAPDSGPTLEEVAAEGVGTTEAATGDTAGAADGADGAGDGDSDKPPELPD